MLDKPQKARATVTLDADLLSDIDALAKELSVARSAIFQAALLEMLTNLDDGYTPAAISTIHDAD